MKPNCRPSQRQACFDREGSIGIIDAPYYNMSFFLSLPEHVEKDPGNLSLKLPGIHLHFLAS